MAVIGAGLVGAGWAIVFARAGLDVRLYDANRSATDGALSLIAEQLQELHSFGLIGDPDEVAAHLTPAYSLADAVDGAAYAQESVLERVDVKRRLLQDLEQAAPPDLVIGSSSSGIPASAFTHGLKIASRVLIVHPVNPPYLVPVVELVPSPETSRATIDFADSLMRGLKRSVVHVRKEVQGFVLNRFRRPCCGKPGPWWKTVWPAAKTSIGLSATASAGAGRSWDLSRLSTSMQPAASQITQPDWDLSFMKLRDRALMTNPGHRS